MGTIEERRNRLTRPLVPLHLADDFDVQRSSLRALYAAKAVGIRLYARRQEIEGLLAALKREERTSLVALNQRTLQARQAARQATRKKTPPPNRLLG